MTILQVTHQFPFPPDRGGRIGIFNFTKYYKSNGHTVILVSMVHHNEKYDKKILDFCDKFYPFPVDARNRIGTALKNIFSSIPFNIYKYHKSAFLRVIDQAIRENNIDVVHIDHLHVAYCGIYIKNKYNLPIVLREHNIETEIMHRYSVEEKSIVKKIYARVQYNKLRHYEPKICEEYNYCFCVTERDVDNLRLLNNKINAKYIPAGVDMSVYRFGTRELRSANVILSLCALNWLPNVYGLEWFVKNVFPLVRQKNPLSELWIAGKGDHQNRIQQLCANTTGVKFIGYVEDDVALFHQVQVLIIPLFSGGGVRIKALNAFATGTPIVSTSIGIEGIPVNDGIECCIANDALRYSESILKLMESKEYFDFITKKAFIMVQYYEWSSIVQRQINFMKELLK
ncbi:MAG: glycosyltransferase family 4 protein [Bacteroidota bacterium]